jgi:hypothetical protein
VKPLLIGALLLAVGCATLPSDADVSALVHTHRQDLDELAAMLQVDLDQHGIIDVSLTTVGVLPGRSIPTLDGNRLDAYRERLSRVGIDSVAMTPLGSPSERHPTFAIAMRGFSGNFTQRGILKADRCPTGFADRYDEQRFASLGSGWCTFTWHSL